MKSLIEGLIRFSKEKKDSFLKKHPSLAEGQAPHTLFISCCDSRIVPHKMTSAEPGELFVVRNIGNIVPPHLKEEESSTPAAIEYAVLHLNVKNIIVCGHSECGAMKAIHNEHFCDRAVGLNRWLKKAEVSDADLESDSSLSPENELSQKNVLQQLKHLEAYPCVKDAISEGTLSLKGWWLDLAKAEISQFVEEEKRFLPIVEENMEYFL